MTENILVTGFGPFTGHKINASWEAVKLLPDHINGFNIIKKEVPVEYDYVETNVPEFWETLNPILVLHTGVSSAADKLTIEKRAIRDGYARKDCSGKDKIKKKACAAEEIYITTGIDVDEVCRSINDDKPVKTCISDNAGRYLCEFIFYTSLNIDKDKTLFVHVPPIGAPYTVEQLAEGLMDIINCCLQQVRGEVCEKYQVQTL